MANTPTPTEPKQEQPKWITLQEAQKLERYLLKNFIPKNDPEFAKKFYYRVESIIPYTPALITEDPDSVRYHFMIQKYHRNKVEKVSVATEGGGSEDIERNARVQMHELNEGGQWVCIDPKANMLIDSDKFKKEYEPDKVME